MALFPNITLAIVEKGKSTFSSSKGIVLEEHASKSFVERMVHSVSHLFGETIILLTDKSGTEKFGLNRYYIPQEVNSDTVIIQLALLKSNKWAIFTVSSENGNVVNANFANRFASLFSMKNLDALVATRNGTHQPLLAIYTRECLTLINEILAKNAKCSTIDYLSVINYHTIDLSRDEGSAYNFLNINTPFEVEKNGKKGKAKRSKPTGDWFA